MKKNFLLIAMLIATVSLKAQTNQLPKLKLELFSSGYTYPLGIENAGDGRLFIVEKAGIIWGCNASGVKRAVPFLDITGKVQSASNEQGLLGLAFDPDYATNGYFYVDYTNLYGNTVIARYSVSGSDPNIANASSELKMLTIYDPAVNHNGGCIRFGDDGYLYIALGDGGGSAGGDPNNFAQNTNKFWGKILRIDVTHGSNGNNYSIPPLKSVRGHTRHTT